MILDDLEERRGGIHCWVDGRLLIIVYSRFFYFIRTSYIL